MRYLISALCALAIVLAAPADVAVAASAECGRVTAYVICVEVAGYVILTKSDRTVATVIVHPGTSSGGLTGYVCLGVDRDYLTGLLTPGMTGYLPEPQDGASAELEPAVLGFAASGLPNTSTSVPADVPVPALGALGALLFAVIGLLRARSRSSATA